MKKLNLLVAMMFVSSTAQAAAGVGINYSTIVNSDSANIADIVEVYGNVDVHPQIALTGKLAYENMHGDHDIGSAVEVGAKFKLYEQAEFNPWIQPAFTYTWADNNDAYSGYVVDAGVDITSGKFTVTPAVSYGEAWDEPGHAKSTYGIKVAYEVVKDQNVYIRMRREAPIHASDVDRLYVGYEVKF
jgi:hypothetical protein